MYFLKAQNNFRELLILDLEYLMIKKLTTKFNIWKYDIDKKWVLIMKNN